MIVDENYIIEQVHVEETELTGDLPGVHIRYNQTDPHVIRDGVDFVAVIEDSEDVYRIDFWGYAYGRLYVTTEGVEELGEDFFDDNSDIPSWTLDPETVDTEDLPWWIPNGTPITPAVDCEVCQEETSVRNVLTPDPQTHPADAEVFCRECWRDWDPSLRDQ